MIDWGLFLAIGAALIVFLFHDSMIKIFSKPLNLDSMRKGKKQNVGKSDPEMTHATALNGNVFLTTACNDFAMNKRASLRGCINDSVALAAIAKQRGYQVVELLGEQMTADNVRKTLKEIAKTLPSDAKFVWHKSSHGCFQEDKDSDEDDGNDEYFVCYDFMMGGLICDDEVYDILNEFKCPTLVISDTCHSASSTRFAGNFKIGMTEEEIEKETIVSRGLPANEIAVFPPKYQKRSIEKAVKVWHISGCLDSETSADYYDKNKNQFRGALSKNLEDALLSNPTGTKIDTIYAETYRRVKEAGFDQSPNFESVEGKEMPSFF